MYCFFLICSYDDEAERITQYERIALEDLEKVEIGECFIACRCNIHTYMLFVFKIYFNSDNY